jgi:hypothetical protein
VRELVPSAEIVNDPGDVHEWPIDCGEIGDIPIKAEGVRPLSLDEFLVDTSTDGIVVARVGRIVFSDFGHPRAPVVASCRYSRPGPPLSGVGGVEAQRHECHSPERSSPLTRRWRKTDSNSRSLREGKGYGQPPQASIAVSDLNL